jgi:hypothetical protein
MERVNGAATYESPPAISMPGGGAGRFDGNFGSERLADIRDRLAEPFDPGEIKWRVTATSTKQTKQGPVKRGQLAAYADRGPTPIASMKSSASGAGPATTMCKSCRISNGAH